ncbi:MULTISPECIES: hypothetical protein [unclassified Methylobacterium]|jgi:hypothetical protein|uniref:hypothetical protein n=1 Tax=unclassified Methylobacterium TaxID=2615210 RepID=UPI0006FA17F2|nr:MULTISPECIES: hypothetical protein [unclassified Methylobacterium]KQO68880.1 hypothetical protein ASF18_22460 [Methylobacterium sp. Leaf89]KQO70908.1 hypothetical protein ASF20_18425 [Methylobacterium sp. Leaf88]KQP72691.1 hypothetical protein ASF41_05655 [Methylobacterium sp. Leaf111]KQT79998.1 hypothetical protein ASG51_05160 [Methylobacterium sp. Leaf465]
MDARLIAMNNEANRIASERLLEQLRDEGLRYRLWVTGTPQGDTLHLRVDHLCPEMRQRLDKVLRGRGLTLEIAEA